MIDGLRAWWRALRHLNHRGYIYILANVLWFLLSLPIVTAPAAWAGLILMTRRAYLQPTFSLQDFWEGFRENLCRSIVLTFLNVVIIGVNVVNIRAYDGAPGFLFDVLRALWVMVLLIWFTIQFYMWPLFYEMEKPTLIGAMGNAGIMLLRNPFFAVGIWAGIVLVLIVSLVLIIPWMLLTGSILAVGSVVAVFSRLEAAGLRQPIPDYTLGEYESNA
jgi:uncharacterized membrane protein YesL